MLLDSEFFYQILDEMQDPVFVKDQKHRWVYGNEAFWKILGTEDPSEYLGKDDTMLFPPDQVEVFWRVDEEVLREQRTIVNEETIASSTGPAMIAITTKKPITLPDGSPGLLGTIRDITDLREQEKVAEKAERESAAKASFMANMSHELRTPLNGIIAIIELLMESPQTRKNEEHLSIVQRSSQGLLCIVNDILDYSKLEDGRMKLHKAPYSLPAIISDTVDTMSSQIAMNNVKLTSTYSANVPQWLTGDQMRVRQILNNLVGNAIKFTNEGEISLLVDTVTVDDKQWLSISVKDTGIGIPFDEQERIFSRFEQVDDTRTRQRTGTGLGLSIVKLLVSQMGGSISVTSEPEKGSTFTTLLPFVPVYPQTERISPRVHEVAPSAVRPLSDNTQAIEESDQPTLSVLVAEDNETNRLVLTALFSQYSADVTFVENGMMAVEMYKSANPDLVLMDISMPELDGYDACRAIRAYEKKTGLGETPVVAFTAHGYEQEKKNIDDCGMTDHLLKPVTIESLFNLLAKYGRESLKKAVPAKSPPSLNSAG